MPLNPPSNLFKPLPLVLALLAGPALAQQATEVVITGSMAERAAVEAPYAITVIDRETLRSAGPLINLSEAMARVPGLVVNNRSNLAQDLQISSRGFGARAGFGVRGVRLYADGIPASGPDGQGQVSHFDLAGAERVEVLRGPFSVLYGNSSGGVIALIGATPKQSQWEAGVDLGSNGLRQVRAAVSTPLAGGFDLKAGVQTMETDGFRPQSSAQRTLANVRLGWRGDSDSVVVSLNSLEQPAQDPLGLERALFVANPYQTASQALDFDTRKETRQLQAGASWKHRFGDGVLRDFQLAAYGGKRSITQYLAIARATQDNPRHGGGVIDFDREYNGAEARLRFALGGLDLQLGAAADNQRDARRGFENFVLTGSDTQQYGVIGALRRDETNRAETRDGFAQVEYNFGGSLVASAGVRSGQVKLSAEDRYIRLPNNGDDSGGVEFSYTNPVFGLRWTAAPGLDLFASMARGFEAPTLGELAYRPDNQSGLNFALKPQTSRQAEVGAKWRAGTLHADLTLFEARVSDEIVIATNAGGRASYQNAGRTLRRGLELAAGWRPTSGLRSSLAVTWLDATYRDEFMTCAGIPCATPAARVRVPAGNRVAGTQRASAFAELAWRDARWGEWGVELRGAARTAVNDANTDFAPGYGLVGLRWTKGYALAGQRLEILARIDNLSDRQYAGSVIVSDANRRFFEPGPPRSYLLGLRLIGNL